MQRYIGTRNLTQVRSHAQKYFLHHNDVIHKSDDYEPQKENYYSSTDSQNECVKIVNCWNEEDDRVQKKSCTEHFSATLARCATEDLFSPIHNIKFKQSNPHEQMKFLVLMQLMEAVVELSRMSANKRSRDELNEDV